mmetsp:Transcript_17839/g.58321  ORF Transcript_17839/g.58321 Transcript_17839/m.58321 type:complete len:206 (-) Transcript_17839:1108-1725(-)
MSRRWASKYRVPRHRSSWALAARAADSALGPPGHPSIRASTSAISRSSPCRSARRSSPVKTSLPTAARARRSSAPRSCCSRSRGGTPGGHRGTEPCALSSVRRRSMARPSRACCCTSSWCMRSMRPPPMRASQPTSSSSASAAASSPSCAAAESNGSCDTCVRKARKARCITAACRCAWLIMKRCAPVSTIPRVRMRRSAETARK